MAKEQAEEHHRLLVRQQNERLLTCERDAELLHEQKVTADRYMKYLQGEVRDLQERNVADELRFAQQMAELRRQSIWQGTG